MQDPTSRSRDRSFRDSLEGPDNEMSSDPALVLDNGEHDRSLIRWSLSLQPEERLAVLQNFVDTFWTPRHG